MSAHRAVVLLGTLALGACAHGPASSGRTLDSAKETPVMTTTSQAGGTGQDSAAITPKISAEQMLLRLLELIRSSKSAADFTPEHLEKIMGVPIEYARDGSGRYGFGEAVTTHWNHGFEADMNPATGARFNFGFGSAPGNDPPMTEICQVDFDQFTAALEAMGFKRQKHYGEHGRFINDWFERGNMRVEVYPEGEFVWTPEKGGGRACVKMVLIP